MVAKLSFPWEKLADKTVLISGATGMIGTCLIDVLMQKNADGLNCKIYALGRNAEKAKSRFAYCYDSKYFEFIPYDINIPLECDLGRVDYILHLASNTHPVAYSNDPIETITTNIIGTNNLLQYAVEHKTERFLFASSVEIYGENRGDVEKFNESYLGYIDCNTLRAGYPESKRCGEALCQAYKQQYGLDVVIPRISRVYGPTMLMSDTKASSQFILKAVAGEDVVLKSAGNQFYSYTYVADAVSGLLTVLLKGENGEAYNIASDDITLKDFAKLCAQASGTKVVFDIPNVNEASGYSTATKAILDRGKLQSLGWRDAFDLKRGIERTLTLLMK
ncbi:NAD-dependent epimerase/dehydratase family protein [uncultured Dysosmobacter sp.]|uniref:NAD-dependent epimerase/dehydratase family protein n=1 Tax=uncultured Dysosmobacter sp. TaxID=2591384 RepID=UPI0026234E27|nr:NAD-dependent epimerase/dehydratase family protein [uncultured Dysosmobacter sp.]